MSSLPHIAVVGAGAFGGWTALRLRERGCRVTLLDTWGPASPRASSGGETRVIRGVYGADRIYVHWVARSLEAWREAESRWKTRLFHPTGLLWMCSADDSYVRASIPLLEEEGLAVSEIGLDDARRRFPQVSFEGIRTVFVEETAGYLGARKACRSVAAALTAAGGELRRVEVRPGEIRNGRMERCALSDGSTLEADAWVFACGPWLGSLFPVEIGDLVLPTRQEVFFFGPPAGDDRFRDGALPVWMELGKRNFYGIPGDPRDGRGFKIADDTRGEPFDPTSGDRVPTAEGVERARSYLALRFPGLAGAPVVESRVCQYENSPDGHLLLDRLPGVDNAWIAGGGSGHGFKLGPAVGAHMAALALGEEEPRPELRLDRPTAGPRRTQFTGAPAQSR